MLPWLLFVSVLATVLHGCLIKPPSRLKPVFWSKDLIRCPAIDNGGICDAECMHLHWYKSGDCKNVKTQMINVTMSVNALPLMSNMAEWKSYREAAERVYYRSKVVINVTHEEYLNITEYCGKLQKLNITNIRVFPWQTGGYCPVTVNATFFLPEFDLKEVASFRTYCEKRDYNGLCDMRCHGFENFEKYDCRSTKMKEGNVTYLFPLRLAYMARPSEYTIRNTEVTIRRKLQTEVNIMPISIEEFNGHFVKAVRSDLFYYYLPLRATYRIPTCDSSSCEKDARTMESEILSYEFYNSQYDGRHD